jgi:hypothetical protein
MTAFVFSSLLVMSSALAPSCPKSPET